MKTLLTISFLLLCFSMLSAQFEQHTWFLGGGRTGVQTGIKFRQADNQPEPYNGIRFPLELQENNIIISDGSSGEVVFYSDGQSVVDGSHRIMPNGAGLRGTPSTMYGTTVVLDPQSCNSYLLFYGEDETVQAPRRVYYSRIDPTLIGNGTAASPLGDIRPEDKNTQLLFGAENAAEGLYALPKSNNSRESWIFMGLRNTNQLLVFDVSSTGIRKHGTYELANFFPNWQSSNQDIFGLRMIYRDTGSEEGQMVIVVSRVEGFEDAPLGYLGFNRRTGRFVDQAANLIAEDTKWVYGIALSADGSKFYFSDYVLKRLSQFDFNNGERTEIVTLTDSIRSGGLGLGPDGRVYWSNVYVHREGGRNRRVESIARINNPNAAGLACDLELSAWTFPFVDQPRLLGAMPTFGSFPERLRLTKQADVSCNNSEGIAYATPGVGQPPFTFRWDNGETSDTARQLGEGRHFVTITSSTGCEEIGSINILDESGQINSLEPEISMEGTLCEGGAVTLSAVTATSGMGTVWITPEGVVEEGVLLEIPDLPAGTVGRFGLYHFVGDCFSDTTYLDLVTETVEILTMDTVVCAEEALLTVANEVREPVWEDGTIGHTLVARTSGTYIYRGSSISGCALRGEIRVTLAPAITLNLPDSISAAECETIVLSPYIGDERQLEYRWGGSLPVCMDCPVQQFVAIASGELLLTVFDPNFGCSVSKRTSLLVRANRSLFVPNAFSPNRDGVNDGFTVFHKVAETLILSLEVYNRWGGLVFRTENIPVNDLSLGWDGSTINEDAGTGTFVYRVVVRFSDGVEEELKGEVFLVR